MKFNKVDKENLECTIEITIEPTDYLPEFKQQLKDLRSKGNFKGFRKGKAPDSFITKMYGKSIISEVVSKAVDKAFAEIIKSEDIKYVAQPLPAKDQMLDPDHKDLTKEYNYALDLGLIAPIEVKGIDSTIEFNKYEVTTDDKELEEHLDNISKTFGTMESTDTVIEGDDVLKVSATELDGKKAKKDGWMSSFDIVMKSVGSDELKEELLKKKKGDVFVSAIKDVTNRPEDTIRKQLLKVEDDDEREIGDMFEFVIEDVERLKPAELTDELIKEKLSTWNLSTIEELKEDFKKNRVLSYQKDAQSMMFRDIMDSIMDHTEVNLSETFLKRWLAESENVTEDKIEETAKSFISEVKWVKIKEQLMQKYNVELTQQDIEIKLHERARSIMMQYGMQDDSFLGPIVERLKNDQNEFYNAVSSAESEKVFSAMIPDLNVKTVKEGSEKFYEIIDQKFNKKEETPAEK